MQTIWVGIIHACILRVESWFVLCQCRGYITGQWLTWCVWHCFGTMGIEVPKRQLVSPLLWTVWKGTMKPLVLFKYKRKNNEIPTTFLFFESHLVEPGILFYNSYNKLSWSLLSQPVSNLDSFCCRTNFIKVLPREDMIKRHPHINRTHNSQPRSLCPSMSLNHHPLNIIIEEDESRTASSRSPSPLPGCPEGLLNVKARRRHANIATISITDNDLDEFDNTFLCPRPAPLPGSSSSSPQSSPDSLKLTFNDLCKFPCPPLTSPRNPITPILSASDLSSSPGAHSTCVPLTPSTSDDEFALPSPRFNPRRAAMQPLGGKGNTFTPYLRPSKKSSRSWEDNDSEHESDSEWYNHEFSQLLSLRSPVSTSFPQQPRPDSMSIPSDLVISPTPAYKRRVSGSFSSKTDTVHPRPRNSKTRSVMIPKYPPPPVPSVPEHLRSPPNTATSPFPSPCEQAIPLNVQRPPPRSSMPADCVFDVYLDGEEGDAESDGSSAFSFTMYEIDFGERVPGHSGLPESPGSVYSQPSLERQQELPLEDIKFELDYQLMLPLSIPGTPIDLEADIAMGFEKLREQDPISDQQPVVEGKVSPSTPAASDCPKEVPSPELSHQSHMSSISSFSFSPSPSPVHQRGMSFPQHEERVLKSKWSSSTLGSIHDEHGHRNRSTSAKLRLYFGGGHSTKRTSGSSKDRHHHHQSSSSSASRPINPTTPQSPFALSLKSPSSASKKAAKAYYSPSLSPSPSTRWPPAHKRGSSANNNNSDVIVIGYGVNGAGLKRRGSTATVSDVGSEDSASSTSSSGLRRKPIPIEMFLRNAA